MQYEITAGSTFPLLKIYLEQGQNVKAESGAMVAMTSDLTLHGKADGGILKGLARKLSGESFFLQELTAEYGPGWALLAAQAPGDIIVLEISPGKEYFVQKNGFLAGTQRIDVTTKVQNLVKGMFSGEGFFVVKISGTGTAFLSTYGASHMIDIPDQEELLIDNGHLIAWQSDMRYDIVKGASSWVSSVTSGEGIACRFYGPGRVYIQTRNPRDLGRWLMPYLPLPPVPQK